MQYVMWYTQYGMFNVQDVMCCVQYDKYDDACYSHGMTLLIQNWKGQTFLIYILASPLT